MKNSQQLLDQFAEKLYQVNHELCQEVPSKVATHEFANELIHLLFPIQENKQLELSEIKGRLAGIRSRFYSLISAFGPKLPASADDLSDRFMAALPAVYEQLLEEADVYLRNDPAAWSVEEIILCYPGFYAICIYRLANEIHRMHVPVLPRIMTEYAHGKTGIDIHPGATIGQNFFIDHGTGVVIGETTEIGNNVKIYQGVTLGALHVEKELANKKRHPTIGDNVIIYAGSTILGGNTVIGHDSIIGGNVWITSSIEPYTVAYRKPKIMFRNHKEFGEPIDFVI